MSDRANEQTSDQANERTSDRVNEQPSDRVTKQPSERATERPSDRVTEHIVTALYIVMGVANDDGAAAAVVMHVTMRCVISTITIS